MPPGQVCPCEKSGESERRVNKPEGGGEFRGPRKPAGPFHTTGRLQRRSRSLRRGSWRRNVADAKNSCVERSGRREGKKGRREIPESQGQASTATTFLRLKTPQGNLRGRIRKKITRGGRLEGKQVGCVNDIDATPVPHSSKKRTQRGTARVCKANSKKDYYVAIL